MAALRNVAFAILLLALAGCGAGGGDKIEPEAKSGGSPILNRDKAPVSPGGSATAAGPPAGTASGQ